VKRILKIVGLVLGGLLLLLVGAVAVTFLSKAPIEDGKRVGGVQQVKDGFVTAYLVDLGPGEVALVDAGQDPKGEAILAALKQRGLEAKAVKAVLLTHGDYDHTAAAMLFPGAMVAVLEPDVALAEGRAVRGPFQTPKPNGIKVTRALKDGERLELGGAGIEVFALPGHSEGSAAFLAHGVLFMGDSAEVSRGGALGPSLWFSASDRARNRASLRALADKLAPRAAEVKAIACAHSGIVGAGLAPLTALAAELGR